jgi:hypothetical protein
MSKRKAHRHVYTGEDRSPAVSIDMTTVLNATRSTKRARVISKTATAVVKKSKLNTMRESSTQPIDENSSPFSNNLIDISNRAQATEEAEPEDSSDKKNVRPTKCIFLLLANSSYGSQPILK